jgi:hypothetical protein
MENKLQGTSGNCGEEEGKQTAIVVPMFLAETLEEQIKLKTAEQDLVEASFIMHKFHMVKKTFQNWACKLPKSYYVVAFNHQKLYFLSKMLGLKSIVKRLHNHIRKPHQHTAA